MGNSPPAPDRSTAKMLLASRALLLMCASCAALQLPNAPRTPMSCARASAPSMQLFGKKKKEPEAPTKASNRRSGFFYDDEVDTVTQQPWEPNFAENGEVDLANVGGVYYLAFVPFLLLFIAYSSGIFSFGYAKGNF